ncbi:hypothetical protein BDQ17DRAFT_898510 [Cyathus striatus]|nr:hypothetical protein BDQ17DRAFT_898510 [Cyathus striatus]
MHVACHQVRPPRSTHLTIPRCPCSLSHLYSPKAAVAPHHPRPCYPHSILDTTSSGPPWASYLSDRHNLITGNMASSSPASPFLRFPPSQRNVAATVPFHSKSCLPPPVCRHDEDDTPGPPPQRPSVIYAK